MKYRDLVKYRLYAGGLAVVNHLTSLSPEELIFDLYLPIKDEDTKKLIMFFEKNLVLAKVDKERFLKYRYKQIKEIVHWIKKNNKYKLFADFSMYVYRNINKKNYNVLCAYQNTLMDTWVNLAPPGHYWYGLDGDAPMFTKELYGNYDEKCLELYEKLQTISKPKRIEILNELLKYELEINSIRIDERNITNIIYSMIGLINKENEKLIFPFDRWFNHYYVSLNFPRKYKDNEYYMNLLDNRKFLLNSEGVIVQCFNAGFFKEIRFKEEFLEDGLILLFRVTNQKEDKHTMGFIDLRTKDGFYLGKNDLSTEYKYGDKFINFILEVYCNLTCDIQDDSLSALKILKSPDAAEKLSPAQPGIYIDIKQYGKGEGRTGSPKSLHTVRPFLRKGNASETAKANARFYGITLPQGYTFVREHTRGKRRG